MISYPLQKPKALLIDMDGTLIDSIPMLYEAYLNFLKSYGILGSQKEFESLMGPSLSEVIKILRERYHLPDESTVLLSMYQQGLEEAYERDFSLFPQALEVLHFAKKQGIQLALVSSAEKQFVKAFAKGAGLLRVFDLLVPSSRGIPSKPSPDLYVAALTSLNIMPAEAVAIEDSMSGVMSATSAGIYTLWIKHNTFFQSRPLENTSLSPHLYRQILDWKEILDYLKGLCSA